MELKFVASKKYIDNVLILLVNQKLKRVLFFSYKPLEVGFIAHIIYV